ncbi:hypothetical protein K438DRAFT_1783781 [Mycena galopus ATCC 62051]|nr:hypothetical protein K438DRAFT_1783781 [Mycena galopus ATCC 62051]
MPQGLLISSVINDWPSLMRATITCALICSSLITEMPFEQAEMVLKSASQHTSSRSSQLQLPTQTSHMCNPISASPILFGAVSLLPDTRYIALGLASISGILYIANGQRPSNKLAGVKNAIESMEKSLQRTKEECMRSHLEVVDLGGRLFEAKLSASKVQTRMLDTPRVTTYKEVVQYLQYGWDIMQDIMKCAKEVEEIRTKTLRIIEAERQHQFSAGIQESREIIGGATTFSFARLTSARRRGYESAVIRNTSCKSMMLNPPRLDSNQSLFETGPSLIERMSSNLCGVLVRVYPNSMLVVC